MSVVDPITLPYSLRVVAFVAAFWWRQGSEQVDIREIAEERKLGVITDRQEGAAIRLVQAWAEAPSVRVVCLLMLPTLVLCAYIYYFKEEGSTTWMGHSQSHYLC